MNEPQFRLIDSNDPEIVKAHARAANTINEFEGYVKSPGNCHCMAKLRFRDPDLSKQLGEDQFFFLWLFKVVYHAKEKLFSGEFFEVPESFQKWHQVSSRLGFEAEDVFDWMVIERGHMRGGFTIRVTRSRLSKAEQVGYDEYIGVTSYEP